jgi:hypothetical protein
VLYKCCKIKIYIAFILTKLVKEFNIELLIFVGGLQAHLRSHIAYSYYKSLQKAALVTQCGWRRRVARKELRNLKMVLNSLICFSFLVRCTASCIVYEE